MYERLDKLRAEVERCKNRIEDDKAKLKQAETRLTEAEHSQILADVGALNLTPEQLSEFLKLATSGKLAASSAYNSGTVGADYEKDNNDDDEAEEFNDEQN